MTELEAIKLLDELRAVYPATKLAPDGMRQYVKAFQNMRVEQAREAVRSAIGSCRFFPTLAEVAHFYGIAREQHTRRVRDEQTRLKRLEEDNLDRPALRDIPAAAEHLAKLRGSEELVHLEPVEDGRCDDCRRDGPRFSFLGKLGLCAGCVASRLRVQAQVGNEAA